MKVWSDNLCFHITLPLSYTHEVASKLNLRKVETKEHIYGLVSKKEEEEHIWPKSLVCQWGTGFIMGKIRWNRSSTLSVKRGETSPKCLETT